MVLAEKLFCKSALPIRTSKAGDGLSTVCLFVKYIHEFLMAFIITLPGKLSVGKEGEVYSLCVDKPLAQTSHRWPFVLIYLQRGKAKRESITDAKIRNPVVCLFRCWSRAGMFPALSVWSRDAVHTQLLACHCASDQKQCFQLTDFVFDDKSCQWILVICQIKRTYCKCIWSFWRVMNSVL